MSLFRISLESVPLAVSVLLALLLSVFFLLLSAFLVFLLWPLSTAESSFAAEGATF